MNNKGKISILIIVIIVLVQLIIGATIYFLFLREKTEPIKLKTIESANITNPKTQINDNSLEHNDSSLTSFDAKDYIKDYTIFAIGDLIVNPFGTESRFFIVSISFEHKQADKKLPDELTNKTPLIKDKLIYYFSRLSVEELQKIDNRDIFKEDIMKTVNSMLTTGRITNVLFEQYVIQ